MGRVASLLALLVLLAKDGAFAETTATDTAAWNAIAVQHGRRARATGDATHYARALLALERARSAEPDNVEAVMIAAWVQLGRHEFATAARLARSYLARRPGDPAGLGVLGDSLMELGRYAEAEAAYQQMLDLRPGPAAYVRGAYWLEMTGALDGALELLVAALRATDPRAAEDRAWTLAQLGNLHAKQGDDRAAAARHRQALEAFPDYHHALDALARIALRAGEAARALDLADRLLAVSPHAERHLIRADALRELGREPEARAAEDRFEALALANRELPDNENHDLVDFYLERRPDPRRALALARREAQRRQDAGTLLRLARALRRNGERAEARAVLQRILAAGARSPEILDQAAESGLDPGAGDRLAAREPPGD